MDDANTRVLRQWRDRGVVIPNPATVTIDPAIDGDRIAPGVTLFPGTRLSGEQTWIGPDCRIGEEAPMTLQDCVLGAGVRLKGGFAAEAVFLDGAEMGSGAHIRPATLLEEQASGAHSVGLKQTVWLSYVTAGSLINFCDALMSGGTSRRHHSEIGSSYIHFNFTPHGDKATASLVGDVPRGVLLDQPPIFLGGQGGLVGPCQVDFGVVVAAGTILRHDALQAGHLYREGSGPDPASPPVSYPPGRYRGVTRIWTLQKQYIGNLLALRAWYAWARPQFMDQQPYGKACRLAAMEALDRAVAERRKRLQSWIEGLPDSLSQWKAEASDAAVRAQQAHDQVLQQCAHEHAHWRQPVPESVGDEARSLFLKEWHTLQANNHLDGVQQLSPAGRQAVTTWLQSIVDWAQASPPAKE